jgi:DNA-binding GntR family transcriptional regulator
VSQTSEKDIYELYSLRQLLEDFALNLLMADLNDRKIKALESVLSAMKKAARAKNHEVVLIEDFNFHRKICELSGHDKLLTVWMNLKRQIVAFLALEKPLFNSPDDYVATHDPVMQAIKSGETEKAREALKQHLDLAYINLVRKIRQRRAS